jgi:NAD(P)-dependent dehydrogenase (short-subunit alcohol dehydrogenase family)
VKDLTGRVAVVTGAASGIGYALAGAFAREGMKLVLADIEAPALQQAEASLRANGAEVIALATDVSRQDQVEQLASGALEAFGAVHVVCNNAGVSLASRAPVWDATIADWQWMLNVNVWSVIHGIRTFVPILLQQTEGHLVNTASIAGLIPSVLGIYSVTKHAVVALSEAVQLQLAASSANVGVSVLCPGWVQTRITEAERNRPVEYRDGPPVTVEPAVAAARSALIGSGTPPSFVADCVVDAIRTGRFYVLPHPEWISVVKTRAEDVELGQPPRVPDLGSIQHPREQ